jgi:ribosomal protein L11 methyltransferase
MKPPAKNWFALTVTPTQENPDSELIDSISLSLMELGAAGTAVMQAPDIVAYIEGDEASCSAIQNCLAQIGCTEKSLHKLEHSNWLGSCPDIWEPQTIDNLTITPVESLETAKATPTTDEILLIPGQGFGTGHHATTRMMISAIQKSAVHFTNRSDVSILDVGTGSGILAIAATKLVSSSHVNAIDIDEDALSNAHDNCTLNNVVKKIALSTTPLENIAGTYDMILANVYGEVLIQMAPDFGRMSKSGTIVLLSGITEIVWPSVEDAFMQEGNWKVTNTTQDGEWMCAHLRRV